MHFKVSPDDVGMRVDAFLAKILPDFSREKVKKWIKKNKVLINEKITKASYTLSLNDVIVVEQEITALEPIATNLLAEKIKIIFQDDVLLVVEKQAGVVVHPSLSFNRATLTSYLEELKIPLAITPDNLLRPGVVHRLDQDTSGLLVLAKTSDALASLQQQFREKTAGRIYLALLNGVLSDKETCIKSYLTRHHLKRTMFTSISLENFAGMNESEKQKQKYRYAESLFIRQATFAHRLSLAQIHLKTGRTHQIRVHAKALDCSVWGDPLYGKKNQLPQTMPVELRKDLASVQRQLLHAQELRFTHPVTKKQLCFTAPIPSDFNFILERLKKFQNLGI